MSEAFVAYVRFEEKLLLLRRSKSDGDFPALWDGVWGIGDTAEEVLARVSESTGIPVDSLHYQGSGPERGVDMGRSLVDVVPVLVVSNTEEVTPNGRYTEAEWIDPGTLQNYNCIFSNLDMENNNKLFGEMYGSVGSFLYIVKTAIGSEKRVADEMYNRLHGSGSLTSLLPDIMSILHPTGMRGYLFIESSALHHVEKLIGRSGPTGMRGYLFIESSALHHVEKLIGRSGGRDPAARRGLNQTPLKNAKTVLPGEAPLADILPYLEPKAVTSGIEVGCIVEIVTGAFKGEKARVLSVAESKEEVSMELYEQPIPMTLNMRGDHVRVVERVE